MTDLEEADRRIQLICEKIKHETLDPAKHEAEALIEKAKNEANAIIAQAKAEAERQLRNLKNILEEERQIFHSSLQQSCKQTLEQLKVKIEKTLFDPRLSSWIEEQLGSAKDHAKLIAVLVNAIEKEGTKSELTALIPKKFQPEQITAELSQSVLNHLKNHTVQVADLPAGVMIRVEGKNLVLDLSAQSLKDMIRPFIRKDFQKAFFSS